MRLRSLILALSVPVLAACEPAAPPGPSVPAEETYAPSLGVDIASMTKFDNHLYYKDVVVGTGQTAAVNNVVTVTYTGYFVDGSSFDDRTTQPTPLNDTKFIAGWVLGIPGMKVGGKRKLVVGSVYGYGSVGTPGGPIPPNATLVFDVELKAIQ